MANLSAFPLSQSQYFIVFKALCWHSADQRQTLQNTSTDPACHFAQQNRMGKKCYNAMQNISRPN